MYKRQVFSSTSTYTNPLKAVEFFKKTKCDALAISYGTMHGANKGKDTKICLLYTSRCV